MKFELGPRTVCTVDGCYGLHELRVVTVDAEGVEIKKVIGEYQAWLFHCCGVGGLNSLNRAGYGTDNFWVKPENVEAFVTWLKTDGTELVDGWNPGELVFCITNSQVSILVGLVESPYVKCIDKFKNKAHGPNTLHVFRLSVYKDFA